MLVFRASKLSASERSTQVDEAIPRPSQNTFWPVKELDSICCAVQGFAKEDSLRLTQQKFLTHASPGCGHGTCVQGRICKLCSGEG